MEPEKSVPLPHHVQGSSFPSTSKLGNCTVILVEEMHKGARPCHGQIRLTPLQLFDPTASSKYVAAAGTSLEFPAWLCTSSGGSNVAPTTYIANRCVEDIDTVLMCVNEDAITSKRVFGPPFRTEYSGFRYHIVTARLSRAEGANDGSSLPRPQEEVSNLPPVVTHLGRTVLPNYVPSALLALSPGVAFLGTDSSVDVADVANGGTLTLHSFARVSKKSVGTFAFNPVSGMLIGVDDTVWPKFAFAFECGNPPSQIRKRMHTSSSSDSLLTHLQRNGLGGSSSGGSDGRRTPSALSSVGNNTNSNSGRQNGSDTPLDSSVSPAVLSSSTGTFSYAAASGAASSTSSCCSSRSTSPVHSELVIGPGGLPMRHRFTASLPETQHERCTSAFLGGENGDILILLARFQTRHGEGHRLMILQVIDDNFEELATYRDLAPFAESEEDEVEPSPEWCGVVMHGDSIAVGSNRGVLVWSLREAIAGQVQPLVVDVGGSCISIVGHGAGSPHCVVALVQREAGGSSGHHSRRVSTDKEDSPPLPPFIAEETFAPIALKIPNLAAAAASESANEPQYNYSVVIVDIANPADPKTLFTTPVSGHPVALL